MNRASSLFVSILTLAPLCASVPARAADPSAEARVHFDRALQLYEERYFDGALAELKKAFELKPSYKLLYNIGQVQLAMQDFAAALGSYREYLEKGGAEIPSARRSTVEKEIAKLEQRVVKLTIETDVPNAELFVDDISVGVTPLTQPLLLNSGTRRISVRHPDYLPQTRRLTLVGGSQDKLTFALKGQPQKASDMGQAAASASTASTPQTTPLPNSALVSGGANKHSGAHKQAAATSGSERKIPWLAWAVTGAFAAGAGVMGVVTLSENSSLNDERRRLGADPNQLNSDGSRVRTLAVVTDGLIVATLAAGAVSVWLTLDSGSSTTRGSVDRNKLAIGFGPSGVALRRQF